MPEIREGRSTSEYEQAVWTGRMGAALAALGAVVAILGGALERLLLAGVGGALALLGAAVVAVAMWAYSMARSRVKSASVTPPTRVYGGRV